MLPGGERLVELPDGTKLTIDDLNRWRWENGVLTNLMYSHQRDISKKVNELQRTTPLGQPFLLWARRTGKTTFELVDCEEFARQNPESVIRFAGQTQKSIKANIMPLWRILLRTCPEDLRAKYNRDEECWVWPNQSRLYISGTSTDDDLDRLRGNMAHRIYVDELGFHKKDLVELIDSILAPQLNSTKGLLIQSTTPPDSAEHSSRKFIRRAEANGMMFKMTVLEAEKAMRRDRHPLYTLDDVRLFCRNVNPQATPDEIELILAGKMKGSNGWEREYLCELVTKSELRACPEFDHYRHLGKPDFRAPNYETNFVFIDQADGTDKFAALFCTYNFAVRKLFVLAEWTERGKNTKDTVDALRAIETRLWGAFAKPKRYSDDPRGGTQRLDMAETYKYPVQTAQKSPGKRDLMDGLSVYMKADKIVVSPDCPNLISQMKDGLIGENKNGRFDYQRTEDMGHLDALDALGMGVRCVQWHKNPAPQGVYCDMQTFVAVESKPELSPEMQKSTRHLAKAFRFSN